MALPAQPVRCLQKAARRGCGPWRRRCPFTRNIPYADFVAKEKNKGSDGCSAGLSEPFVVEWNAYGVGTEMELTFTGAARTADLGQVR